MTDIPLGHLEKVSDLRAVWQTEASHFTPWLAQEENLARLGHTIGLDLELDETEKNVGPFRADIIAKDTLSDNWVLIENQLDRTDHTHLGQLLTYAAGLNAVTIVWIADHFTDEHRAALDWLNEVTTEDVNFFGLEIELWRIGSSPIAPKFNIISKPNQWTKTITAARHRIPSDLTPTKQLQLEYWTALREHLETNNSFIRSQKPLPQHWTNFAVGRSNFFMLAYANTQQKRIGIQLILEGADAKIHFHLLKQDKNAIEQELGIKLKWRELPQKKQSHITLNNPGLDPTNREQWPQQHTWLQATLEAFHKTFSPRIKALNADDYEPDEEDIEGEEDDN